MIIEARAKINLVLDVLYKRNDGYHEVAMIMQSIALADKIDLCEQEAGISLATNCQGLECGTGNLAYRAAALMAGIKGGEPGIHISLEKNIPLAAGLAGGSSDAAAVLTGLNRFWNVGLSQTELVELAAQIGSDVPFCLTGGTMLATGRGEILRALPAMSHAWVVLAKPPVEVSTAWVYQNYQPAQVVSHPDLKGMIASLAQRDLPGVAGKLGNVLETVTIPAHPAIAEIKKYMIEYGAMASLMSGSGPTVFALVADQREAERIGAALKHHTDAQIVVTETVGVLEGEDGTTVVAN